VVIEEFDIYFWQGGKWVKYQQPFSSNDFADWYSCPGAYISPDQECTDPYNWTSTDTLDFSSGDSNDFSKAKWVYVGVDDNGNRVKGEAIIECKP